MLIASSLLLYTLINLLFIITRLYGLLIESSTIYFQLFQRIHRSILIRKRNQTRRNPQDSSICLNLFPPYSRKVDYKQDATHTYTYEFLSPPLWRLLGPTGWRRPAQRRNAEGLSVPRQFGARMGERISRLIGIPKIPPGVGESSHFYLSPLPPTHRFHEP